MTPGWLEALEQYLNTRQEAGELEEVCDGSCLDSDRFYTCQYCIARHNLEYRMEALMKTWGETWAVRLEWALQKEAKRA